MYLYDPVGLLAKAADIPRVFLSSPFRHENPILLPGRDPSISDSTRMSVRAVSQF